MNTKKANELGYDVSRGAYHCTTDDRIDHWYVFAIGHPAYKWHGYRTRKEALKALEQALIEKRYGEERERMLSMRSW